MSQYRARPLPGEQGRPATGQLPARPSRDRARLAHGQITEAIGKERKPMKLRKSARLTIAAVAVASLTSCAASTQLTSSWADPTAAGHHYKKIVVLGVTNKDAVRRE